VSDLDKGHMAEVGLNHIGVEGVSTGKGVLHMASGVVSADGHYKQLVIQKESAMCDFSRIRNMWKRSAEVGLNNTSVEGMSTVHGVIRKGSVAANLILPETPKNGGQSEQRHLKEDTYDGGACNVGPEIFQDTIYSVNGDVSW